MLTSCEVEYSIRVRLVQIQSLVMASHNCGLSPFLDAYLGQDIGWLPDRWDPVVRFRMVNVLYVYLLPAAPDSRGKQLQRTRKSSYKQRV